VPWLHEQDGVIISEHNLSYEGALCTDLA